MSIVPDSKTPQTSARAVVSEYQIRLLPDEHKFADFAAVRVCLRESGQWAVRRLGHLLDSDGCWEVAGRLASREWFSAREFDLETALRLAEEAAPKVVVAGATVAEELARRAVAQ